MSPTLASALFITTLAVATGIATVAVRHLFGKLDQIHVLVNDRLTRALTEITLLKAEVAELKNRKP